MSGERAGGREAVNRASNSQRVLVVLAHPDPQSLNGALAAAVMAAAERAGGDVVVHDLYRDGFDPRLATSEFPRAQDATTPQDAAARATSVHFADDLAARYATDLVHADVVVIVHPVWFFHVPAVLKGWVDRVVREDVAFELDPAGEVRGLLTARSALVITTANTSPATEAAVFGAPIDTFWRTIVFGPAGVDSVERLALSPVRTSHAATRSAWLAHAADAVARHVGRCG